MANSFLDKTGLTYLWGKITALVATKQDTLTFDTTPTASSTNPVTSGGIKSALDGKAASDHTQAVNKGGTNITSYTTGDILYASAQTTLSKLNGNTTTTRKFLKSVATTSGTAVAPAWDTLVAGDIPDLAWSKITSGKPTTLSGYGITDAAASDHVQAATKGGTGIQTYTKGDILYASAANTLAKLAIGTAGKFLKATADGPAWDSLPSASSSTAGITKVGASGGAAAYSHTHSDYVAKSGDTMTGVLVANNFVSKYGVEFQNSSGTNVGGIFQDMEGANQFYMDEYTTSGVRECYLLPTPNATTASFYDILTSKNAVTVAQGGTGATDAATARTNLGLGSMATASTGDYIAKSGDTMTGSLNITNAGRAEVTASNIDITSVPATAERQDVIVGKDANGDVINFYRSLQETDGSVGMEFNARRTVGNSTKFNGVTFKISPTGERSLAVSDAGIWRSALGVVSKDGDTMTGNLVFNNGSNYKGINIKGSSGAPTINIYNTGTRVTIDEYAEGSTGGERYLLPIPSSHDSDVWYDILTTKDGGYLPLAGGTMTGPITLSSTGLYTNNAAGYSVNQYGNFTHRRTNSSDTWGIIGANGNALTVAFDTGNTTVSGTLMAPTMKVYDANTSYDVLTTKTPVTAFKDMTITLSSLSSGSWAQQSITQFTTPTGYVRTGISVVGGSTTAIRSYVYALTNANANWVLLYNASGNAVSGTLQLRASYILQSQSKEFTQ